MKKLILFVCIVSCISLYSSESTPSYDLTEEEAWEMVNWIRAASPESAQKRIDKAVSLCEEKIGEPLFTRYLGDICALSKNDMCALVKGDETPIVSALNPRLENIDYQEEEVKMCVMAMIMTALHLQQESDKERMKIRLDNIIEVNAN